MKRPVTWGTHIHTHTHTQYTRCTKLEIYLFHARSAPFVPVFAAVFRNEFRPARHGNFVAGRISLDRAVPRYSNHIANTITSCTPVVMGKNKLLVGPTSRILVDSCVALRFKCNESIGCMHGSTSRQYLQPPADLPNREYDRSETVRVREVLSVHHPDLYARFPAPHEDYRFGNG